MFFIDCDGLLVNDVVFELVVGLLGEQNFIKFSMFSELQVPLVTDTSHFESLLFDEQTENVEVDSWGAEPVLFAAIMNANKHNLKLNLKLLSLQFSLSLFLYENLS